VNLAYDDRGRGDSVLFIAGRGGAGRTWHLHQVPEFLRALREWLELLPVSATNFFPMDRIYDFLHGFLDFENAKRLIAYGLILIVMMIVRPDGLLTRDSLKFPRLKRWTARHA